MATFYLINNVTVGTSQRYAGELVDDTLESTTPITAAGGVLVASGLTGMSTAAGISQSLKKRGADMTTIESVMQAAYEKYIADFAVAHDTVANATATNQNTIATNQNTTATCAALSMAGAVHYLNPIAAELVSIVADVVVADGAQIIAAQPDVPRKLQVGITDANASISAGTLDLVGTGPAGEAVTESVTLTGGSATKATVNAYSHVTSATVAGLAGNEGADKVSVGVGPALGLPIPSGAASVTVYKANVDSADEAVGVVDATARTIAPTTAANAVHDYDFQFRYTVTPTQNAHNHTQDQHTHTQNAHTHTLS